MTLPARVWTNFYLNTIERVSANNADNLISYWTTENIRDLGKMGNASLPGPWYWKFHTLIKPSADDFELAAGLDDVIDYGVAYNAILEENTPGCTSWIIISHTMNYPAADQWIHELVSGRYYDGVNQWDAYPPYGSFRGVRSVTVTPADFPYSTIQYIAAYDAGCWGNNRAPYFFQNGIEFTLANYAGCGATPWVPTEQVLCYFLPQYVRVHYLNPVVNGVSRTHMKPAGGVSMILYGLGFDQEDCEIADATRNPNNNCGPAWNSIIDFIYFIGKQGQGTTTLSRVAGDFIVDSDEQITIPSMPALSMGTYDILLAKNNVGPGGCAGTVDAYAGDWRADENGICTEGVRFSFLVTEAEGIDDGRGTMFFSKWAFKAKDGSKIFQYWAPIDVRSTDRFYDGRLISESGITRSIDDKSGLPNVSDMSVDVAIDLELRQILGEYMLKNQLVELSFGWTNQPESWKQSVITMIVDDHDGEGNVLNVLLKDISQKYFRVTVPRYPITLDEYPNAHSSAVGQPMPDPIGLCSRTIDPPGAIEAMYIDQANFKYLAGRGSLHAVLQVYSNGELQTEGAGNDYTISWEAPGRTYINFNSDQGENKITFNCEGYMFAPWNSANGYVQNPAYVIGFLFAFIGEVPGALIDLTALDDLAAIFEDKGEEESGFWIGQSAQSMETAVQELNFTFGVKVWPDRYGRFTFGIKDKSNYQSNIWIFEQIDALKPSKRKENLRDVMNYVKAQFGFAPTSSGYSGSYEQSRQSAVDDFEAVIEASDSPWKFPWTNSEALVIERVGDELLKRGYGLKEISFPLAIDWIFELDIFDSFIYQNPFMPTLSGAGEQQRYYYVKSLQFNFVDNTIGVIGIDLQYLLRQCMIIGVCADLAESWNDATEAMKMYGYICDCDTGFPDGEACKKICKCE